MLFIGAQTPRIGGSARKALRRGPEPALYASLDVDCRIARRQTRAKLSSTTESSIAGRRTTETIRGRRPGSPAVVPVVDRQIERAGSTCATAALTPGRLGQGRRAENIGGDGLKVNPSLSLNPAPFSSSKRAVSGGVRATTGKDESGDRVDQFVLTCCRGAATPSWSWCWRPCRWRPRGPC